MVRPQRDRLCECVEVDEVNLGGREKGAPGRSRGRKSLVVAAAEENGDGIGRLRLRRTPDAFAASIEAFFLDAVEPGNRVRTDGSPSYSQPALPGLPAPQDGDRRRSEADRPALPAGSSRGPPAEALAAGNAPRRCGEAPSGLLPRGIRLPVQPLDFASARPPVLQALAAGRPHRPAPESAMIARSRARSVTPGASRG